MKRQFTKYPSNYVRASQLAEDYQYSLKEGQLVKVKSFQELKDTGWFVDDMAKYCGRVYEVSDVDVYYQPGFVALAIPYGEYPSPYLPDPKGWQFREDGLIPLD